MAVDNISEEQVTLPKPDFENFDGVPWMPLQRIWAVSDNITLVVPATANDWRNQIFKSEIFLIVLFLIIILKNDF